MSDVTFDPDRVRAGPAPEPSGCGLRMWHLMAGVAALALVFWMLAGFLVVVLFFVIVVGPAMVIAPAVVFVARRTSRQDATLNLLAAAAEAGVPPGPALAALADLCGGEYRRKLLSVSFFLERGLSLPDALDREPGTIPRTASGVIRVGWEVGDPARALRDAAAAGASWRPHRQAVVKALAYALGMLLVLQLMGAFLAYSIAPKFRMIFRDFGRPLPSLTRFVLQGEGMLVGHPLLTVALALLELMFVMVLCTLLAQYVGGPEVIPLRIDRPGRRRHAAAILRALALVVEAGRPMSQGLLVLSRSYPHADVRARLSRVGERVEAGENWIPGLRAEGLIGAADAAVLDSAQRAGNLAWALRELAEGSERRLNYRLQAWSQAALPVVVLAVGAVVALVAIAYFLPLITLIEGLAG